MSNDTAPDTASGETPKSAAEPSNEAKNAAPTDAAGLAEENAKLRDQLLRAVADADNTRKQAAKEIADSRAYAVSSFARDLLSVTDNFDRALAALTPEVRAGMGESGQSLLTGVEMVDKELKGVFARHGVQAIKAAKGDKFDPNTHQAAAQIPSDAPKDCIAEVIQSGWMIGQRVLRPAMVAVSAGAPPAPEPTPEANDPPAEASSDGEDAASPGGRVDTTI